MSSLLMMLFSRRWVVLLFGSGFRRMLLRRSSSAATRLRTCLLATTFVWASPAQTDVAGIVARVKAASSPGTEIGLLEKAVHSCEASVPPNENCADAYDWYGMLLQQNQTPGPITPETLRKVEPLYRRALELREGGNNSFAAMALSLELEAMASEGIDPKRAQTMRAEARQLRDANVKAIQEMAGAPVSPPNAEQNTVQKVGTEGRVTGPSVLFKFDPEYSPEARSVRYSGTVILSLVVNASGRATEIRVVKGLGFGLDEKAVEAVMKWKFRPGMKDGNPVNVRAQIEVNFHLL